MQRTLALASVVTLALATAAKNAAASAVALGVATALPRPVAAQTPVVEMPVVVPAQTTDEKNAALFAVVPAAPQFASAATSAALSISMWAAVGRSLARRATARVWVG